jgi:hypothetical protein
MMIGVFDEVGDLLDHVLDSGIAVLGEGAAWISRSETTEPRSAPYVTDFLATSDGLSLAKAFMLVENPKLRRAIVRLVEEIAPEQA